MQCPNFRGTTFFSLRVCLRETNAMHIRQKHKKAKHPTPRRCPQCSSVFPSKKSLRKHIAAEHPQRCAACGKSFGSKSALQSHRRDKHLPMRNNGTGAVQPITSTVQNPPQLEYKCDQYSSVITAIARSSTSQVGALTKLQNIPPHTNTDRINTKLVISIPIAALVT
ncbi:hypothetical protein V8B97DRAFT_686752 [Scleroderma yunnanense]